MVFKVKRQLSWTTGLMTYREIHLMDLCDEICVRIGVTMLCPNGLEDFRVKLCRPYRFMSRALEHGYAVV